MGAGGGGGGGTDGGRTGSENAALGIGGGAESRLSGPDGSSLSTESGRVGAGRPIKVGACGRMLSTRPPRSASASASGGCGAAWGEVSLSDVGRGCGATDATGEVGRSGSAGGGVNTTRSGLSITWVTSFESSPGQSGAASLESSAPQSVSISSVMGGVDGRLAGASLARRGGTEDDTS